MIQLELFVVVEAVEYGLTSVYVVVAFAKIEIDYVYWYNLNDFAVRIAFV